MSTAVSTPVIPHSRPFLGKEEVEAVSRVLASRHIAEGPEVESLEKEWSAATGTRGAACVGSGLAALRLTMHAMGVKQGGEVIVPAYSCISVLNAVLALGATPVLADVERDRWTLDPVSAAQQRTSRTKAIIAVHLFGMPARLGALEEIGVPVIEDCAHGIGGFVGKGPFGGATAASVASFYATKMIAAGEGGVVASNHEQILAAVRQARNPSDQTPNGVHLNDKMTDMEAAIARVQLSRLKWTLSEREKRARRYSQLLSDVADRGLLVLPGAAEGRIWYRYAVRLTHGSAAAVAGALQKQGIFADQPVWDLRGAVKWMAGLQGTEIAFDRVLSLPLYPDLTDAEQERVCERLTEVMEGTR